MSLWFRYRDKQRTAHYITIPFEPLALIALVGVFVALLVQLLLAYRDATTHSPIAVAAVCAATLAIRLSAITIAKISVMRQGRLVTFGPRLMSLRMRVLYAIGYLILAFGSACTLLFLLVSRTSVGS